MLFPAVTMGDMIMGLDFHTIAIPPSPKVPKVPHPYFGVIFLWMTPKFPDITVFINGKPACTAGAMGYGPHIPMGIPLPPEMTNFEYFRRHVKMVPKALMLMALTVIANMAIAGIAAFLVKPDSETGKFINEVTGIDASSWGGIWKAVEGNIDNFTKWSTWVKLLMPPLPYPGGQGSSAIGSPNVQVNGGALGFLAPLMASSCTEIPIVPNAMLMGFSNVLVGVSLEAMGRALLVHASQAAVAHGVAKGVDKVGKLMCGCE